MVTRRVVATVSVLAALVPAGAVHARPSLPVLTPGGIGPVAFGIPRAQAVASLSRALGRPTAEGVSRACGPRFTEVAWHDLIAEFRAGTFTGYRFLEGGWSLWTSQSPHRIAVTRPPAPALETARGVTLGSTLSRLRTAYRTLRLSGAVEWTASNGLRFVESSTVAHPQSPTNRIVEIHVGTCGTDQ
jgi:hypothetical protein